VHSLGYVYQDMKPVRAAGRGVARPRALLVVVCARSRNQEGCLAWPFAPLHCRGTSCGLLLARPPAHPPTHPCTYAPRRRTSCGSPSTAATAAAGR
jgi:hypothetical protein